MFYKFHQYIDQYNSFNSNGLSFHLPVESRGVKINRLSTMNFAFMTTCKSTQKSALTSSESELFDEQTLALQSKALSHPARLRILKILFTLNKVDGCLNSDLVSELGLAQSTVSEHLRILKSAGFITTEPMPPKTCYRINQEQLARYLSLFNEIFS